jgi:hypothetical protein
MAKRGQKKRSRPSAPISGGFHRTWDRTLAGQEDVEFTTMVFETTSAFTSTTGATSYLQIKGNSLYHPYPSVSTSPAGYARMYTQYALAEVISAKCEVVLWSGVSGQDEPFRIVVLPCSSGQYSTYSTYSNVSSLAGVPHAVQGVFSPGGVMPRVSAVATSASIYYGERKENVSAESVSGSFSAASGADPSNLWYFLVGYQNFAGTTTTNQQAQVKLTYKVKWYRPVSTAEQAIDVDFFGNEKLSQEAYRRLRLLGESKAVTTRTDERVESKDSSLRQRDSDLSAQRERPSSTRLDAEYELVELNSKLPLRAVRLTAR